MTMEEMIERIDEKLWRNEKGNLDGRMGDSIIAALRAGQEMREELVYEFGCTYATEAWDAATRGDDK